jgi:hypothetical protein
LKKLISSSEAADILGLSLQGIHYRIKKGQLESLKQDGKTYVYLDQELIKKQNNPTKQPQQNIQNSQVEEQHNQQPNSSLVDEFQKITLKSKDEQIAILKHTLKLMRKQYKSEIHRLDKNHKQTLKVFQSEVELLKSAFSEMKNIYQIEHQENHRRTLERDIVKHKMQRTNSHSNHIKFMDIKEFFVYMKRHHKTDAQIKSIILDRIKHKDKRFIYNKETKEVLIYKNAFLDLI